MEYIWNLEYLEASPPLSMDRTVMYDYVFNPLRDELDKGCKYL